MSVDSYQHYLQLLELPRSAPEKDIRAAVTRELRVWTQRTNSPKLELRQQAERMIATLEAAEKVLLGLEGQVIRRQLGESASTGPEIQAEVSIDAETVARTIERFALSRGRKAQERQRTGVHKRAKIFYRGVEYVFEELVHKKYQAARDMRSCTATHGGLVLFDWYCMADGCMADGIPGQGGVRTYVRGPWVADLISAAAELVTE